MFLCAQSERVLRVDLMSRMRLGVSPDAKSGFISTPHALCTAGAVVGAAGLAGSAVVTTAALPTTAIGIGTLAAGLWAGGELLVDEDKRILLKKLDFQVGKKEAEAQPSAPAA